MKFTHWLVAALLLAGCASTDQGARMQAPSGPIAFEVGPRKVTVAEVQDRMLEFQPQIQQALGQGQTPEQIVTAVFDSLIQEELLLQQARVDGVGVNPSTVDSNVAQQQPDQGGLAPDQSPVDMLKQRRDAAQQQLILNVISRQISADQFKARHILVETEQEANLILSQLSQGTNFASLARKQSQDPESAVKGGELGWVARGNFVPEFEQAAFDEKNTLGVPFVIKSQFGFHVIEVADRALNRPFEGFDELSLVANRQELYQQQFLPWYAKLRQDAEANGRLKVLVAPGQLPLPFDTQPAPQQPPAPQP